jgi:hypothetical protein
MPDYASILRRSISGLADPTPDMREAVYQRARAALARQLTAVDPPLSTREIESQHQELEDAVVRLESEFAPQEMAVPVAAAADGPEAKQDFLFTPTPPPPPPGMDRRSAAGGMSDFSAPPPPQGYEEDGDDLDEDEERGSRLPLLILIACIVLVLVGVGAYVYAERGTLFASADQGAASEDVASADDSGPTMVAAPAAPGDDATKRDDRLTNGTEPPPASAATDAGTSAAAAMTGAQSASAPASDSPTSPAGLPLENLSSLQGDNPSGSDQASTDLVQQRAIYYFQGSEGQAGEASDGTVTWSEITKDNHPAIQAMLKIPERNVTVGVTIYKNYDSSLPASHLVEVQFYGTVSDSPIQKVPALVLKQTEQARGQPLAGAAVPVTNELFWIALSSDPGDVDHNIQLLREGSWFDIPILFSDQTRALLTFEKGVPGDKVFQTVMASWTPA